MLTSSNSPAKHSLGFKTEPNKKIESSCMQWHGFWFDSELSVIGRSESQTTNQHHVFRLQS